MVLQQGCDTCIGTDTKSGTGDVTSIKVSLLTETQVCWDFNQDLNRILRAVICSDLQRGNFVVLFDKVYSTVIRVVTAW